MPQFVLRAERMRLRLDLRIRPISEKTGETGRYDLYPRPTVGGLNRGFSWSFLPLVFHLSVPIKARRATFNIGNIV